MIVNELHCKLEEVAAAYGCRLEMVSGVPSTSLARFDIEPLPVEQAKPAPAAPDGDGPLPHMSSTAITRRVREALLEVAEGRAVSTAADRVAACDQLLRLAGR